MDEKNSSINEEFPHLTQPNMQLDGCEFAAPADDGTHSQQEMSLVEMADNAKTHQLATRTSDAGAETKL
jgi:hypothetical protein